MNTLVLLRALLVAVLILLNAFFVAAEFALLGVRETRIQQLIESGRTGARAVLRLHQNFDQVLLAVQLGVTLASLGLGWAGEPFVAHLLEGVVGNIPYVLVYSTTISFVLAFVLITYLVVILGEVVPKSVALQRGERVALAVAAPMEIFMTLMRPFLAVMSRSARLVLRLFGSRQMQEGSHSPEEIRLIATASRRVGLLPAQQEEMLHRVLDLSDVLVREIMVPRTRIFSLSADLTLAEAMAKVVEEQHSRVPVFDPKLGPEHIVGVLYSKDLSRLMHAKLAALATDDGSPVSAELPVRRIMRSVLVVPETKPVIGLLVEFKKNKRHLAVVVDEFGSTSGVVTVEDVLEQIVGEIEDEFDVAPRLLLPLESGALVLDGGENIRDLETQHHLVLPRDQGFETLGGFVLAKLERIPRGGEMLEYDGRRFTVLKMDGLRIAQVKVEPAVPKSAPSKPLERAGG
ncbi:MAG TPA: hemolysin family protein [Terriglobales bacterium]|nr:hemolysin family protein [Terriglobales bacterium]